MGSEVEKRRGKKATDIQNPLQTANKQQRTHRQTDRQPRKRPRRRRESNPTAVNARAHHPLRHPGSSVGQTKGRGTRNSPQIYCGSFFSFSFGFDFSVLRFRFLLTFFGCLFFFLFRIYFYSFLVNLSLLICFFPCFVGNRFPCFLSPFYFVLFRRKFTVISCSFLSLILSLRLFLALPFSSEITFPLFSAFLLLLVLLLLLSLPILCACRFAFAHFVLRVKKIKSCLSSQLPSTISISHFLSSANFFFSSEKCNVTKSSCNTSKMSISHSHSFFI